jgi:hypothetical protein
MLALTPRRAAFRRPDLPKNHATGARMFTIAHPETTTTDMTQPSMPAGKSTWTRA